MSSGSRGANSGRPSQATAREHAPQQRIVYVHGSGRQSLPSELKLEWDEALFGHDLGELSKIAYWRNTQISQGQADGPSALPRFNADPEDLVRESIRQLSRGDSPQQSFLRRIARNLGERARKIGERQQLSAAAVTLHTQNVCHWLASDFLPDLHAYLFNKAQREHAQAVLRERLLVPQQCFVVVAHELGAVIAYEVLRNLASEGKKVEIRSFLTIGSIISSPAVRDRLAEGETTIARPRTVLRWSNIGHRQDPTAYRLKSTDRQVSNETLEDDDIEFTLPQPATTYLGTKQVRNKIRQPENFGGDFGQIVSSFRVASDVVRLAEDGGVEKRHDILIEYADIQTDTDDRRSALQKALRQVTGESYNQTLAEYLERFASAYLTRGELEKLAARLDLDIKIWQDSRKSSLLYESVHTVQAFTAERGYDATGRGIGWAVLDTGVDAGHPHFQTYNNVVAHWDCTKRFSGDESEPRKIRATERTDYDGHGTHVAGIIAGRCPKMLPFRNPPEGPQHLISGVAPETKIYSFKVLKDNGAGKDSFIIKALDHVARINDRAKRLEIHGVNLSLGGPFDPEVYGCGHSPLCRELRRLWNQGVIVVIAAGNEGLLTINAGRRPSRVNRALSIDDPANLDEAITVGSVHKSKPFTYGISHF